MSPLKKYTREVLENFILSRSIDIDELKEKLDRIAREYAILERKKQSDQLMAEIDKTYAALQSERSAKNKAAWLAAHDTYTRFIEKEFT
jgi:ABC-type Fe3+-hydroxamate transport system substrate-binding protein